MKEQITNDLEKFTNIINGLDEQLITLVLTDIIAKLSVNDTENNKKNYDNFDEIVKNIKNFLDAVDLSQTNIPNILDSIQTSVENVKKMKTECEYSIRTLTWVKDLFEEEENNA